MDEKNLENKSNAENNKKGSNFMTYIVIALAFAVGKYFGFISIIALCLAYFVGLQIYKSNLSGVFKIFLIFVNIIFFLALYLGSAFFIHQS
ncbi:hypothetical protein [Comamonas jiangduensis]|uniref:hypothetical protein n=1 Tax=Comamonas jiangduensis TaxID=1194168 RepID=UPI003BF86D29